MRVEITKRAFVRRMGTLRRTENLVWRKSCRRACSILLRGKLSFWFVQLAASPWAKWLLVKKRKKKPKKKQKIDLRAADVVS